MLHQVQASGNKEADAATPTKPVSGKRKKMVGAQALSFLAETVELACNNFNIIISKYLSRFAHFFQHDLRPEDSAE